MPRIQPLDPPYEPEVAEMLDKWMPPGGGIEPLKLFRTLAHHNELSSRMRPLGAGILARGVVAPRLREVMIHRTCALCGAEYEWGVHAVAFGRPLGFTDEQVSATVSGGGEPWAPAEQLVMRLADELHETSTVSDALYAELAAVFNDQEILELVVTAGWYHTISFVINAAGIEHEPWAERFPAGARSGPRT